MGDAEAGDPLRKGLRLQAHRCVSQEPDEAWQYTVKQAVADNMSQASLIFSVALPFIYHILPGYILGSV